MKTDILNQHQVQGMFNSTARTMPDSIQDEATYIVPLE